MPLRLPGSNLIHPAPSILTSEPSETRKATPTCAICHREPSSYTCPSCNVPYCSLACYKDEKRHARCVGTFQQRTAEEIRAAERKESQHLTPEETAAKADDRNKVLDLLRRYQQEQDGDAAGEEMSMSTLMMQLQDEEEGEGDEGSEDLDEAVNEVDLPSDQEALLALLSDEQRRAFEQMIGRRTAQGGRDPSQIAQAGHSATRTPAASAASRFLSQLASEDKANIAKTRRPWWMKDDLEEKTDDISIPSQASQTDFSTQVKALSLRLQRAPSTSAAGPPSIFWNCVALLLCYTYTLLHLERHSLATMSFDTQESDPSQAGVAAKLLTRLCPLIVADPRSEDAKLLLSTPGDASSYLLQNLGEQDRSVQPASLLLELYKHIVRLFDGRISHIRQVEEDGSDNKLQLALGDIAAFLESISRSNQLLDAVTLPMSSEATSRSEKRKVLTAAQRKLVFYAASMANLTALSSLIGTSAEADKTHLADLSAAVQSSTKDAEPVQLRPHHLKRSARTIWEEIELLQGEGQALKDEERWQTAWRVEWDRMTEGQKQASMQGRNAKVQAVEDSLAELEMESKAGVQESMPLASSIAELPPRVIPAPIKKTTFGERRLARQSKAELPRPRRLDVSNEAPRPPVDSMASDE